MKRKTILVVGAILWVTLPVLAAAPPGRGVVIVGPAFVPLGWYDFYGPYYYGYYGGYPDGPRAGTGEVKLDSKVKDAEVFVNGDYAGTVKQLKTMRMKPGNYDFSIRAAGRETFEERVYVVAGKTLKLHPDLRIQSTTRTP